MFRSESRNDSSALDSKTGGMLLQAPVTVRTKVCATNAAKAALNGALASRPRPWVHRTLAADHRSQTSRRWVINERFGARLTGGETPPGQPARRQRSGATRCARQPFFFFGFRVPT